MRLYFAGAEIPSWRTLLTDEGVVDMAMSYVGLARRVKFARPWLVNEKFVAGTNVLLDSGAYSLRDVPAEEQLRLADEYLGFVQANLDALEYVIEMDAPGMTRLQLSGYRQALFEIAPDKMIVVAHDRDGSSDLMSLASFFPRIAVASLTFAGRDISGQLKQLDRAGVQLFGVGMLKVEAMTSIPWHAVMGTSWTSPARYGETVVFSGGRVEQFHAREKESARRRHYTQIRALGCDPAKVLANDRDENLRLSIRSWQAQLSAVKQLVTSSAGVVNTENADHAPGAVTNTLVQNRHETLPGVQLQMVQETYTDPVTGQKATREIPLVRRSDVALRNCSNCRLASVPCPKYEPGQACAFHFPAELRKPEQVRAAAEMVVEMQLEALLRGEMEEQMEGGHNPERISKERAATWRMLKEFQDMGASGFKVTVEGRGGRPGTEATIMERLFGARPQAIAPAPASTAYAEVLDAEFVEGT